MNLLNDAIKAHQSGNFPLAKQCYLKQLSYFKNDVNANQLLGALLFNQGEYKEAKLYLKKSLSLNSKQAHVLCNLASCYFMCEQVSEAKSYFKKAINCQVDYLDSHIKLIKLLKVHGDKRELVSACKKGMFHFPNNIYILESLADAYAESNELEQSITLYNNILTKHPNGHKNRLNLGVAHRKNGRPELALEQYLYLQSNQINSYQLFHNIANAYSDLGNLTKAIDYYQRTLMLNNLYIEAHRNLNDLLWETNQKDKYLNSFKLSLQSNASDIKLNFAYIEELIRVSMFQEAKVYLSELGSQFLNFAKYHDLRAQTEIGLDDNENALESQKQAVELNDVTTEQLIRYAKNLIEHNNVQEAEFQLQRALKFEPNEQMAIAYLGVCWRLMDNPREKILNNYNDLVCEYILPLPTEHGTVENFCHELNDYLDEYHTGTNQPLGQTLVNGTQTRGALFSHQSPLIQTLVKCISDCINDYIQRRSNTQQLDISKRHVNSFEYAGSWSVRLSTGGFHAMHVHPMGWISSVLYIELPDCVEKGNQEGWLCLGEPALSLKPKLEAIKFVKPVVGKLVLFPSYMWHGTVPFDTGKQRTTIVFDAIPNTN